MGAIAVRTRIADLDDVNVSGITDGQEIVWSDATHSFVPKTEAIPASFFVGPNAPAQHDARYAWLQTGLGPDGTDCTLWFEDGT